MAPGTGSNLRDHDTFPPLSQMGRGDTVSDRYWMLDLSGGMYRPHRHWCFLGEINNYDNGVFRVMLDVCDMEGRRLPVCFYTQDKGLSIYHSCKEGYTVAVLYPEQFYFREGVPGVKVKSVKQVKIIPHSLETLLAANDLIFSKDAAEKCSGCEKTTALSRCGRCEKAYYCGEECQKNAWMAGHKSECRAVGALSWFTEKDWESFDGLFAFQ